MNFNEFKKKLFETKLFSLMKERKEIKEKINKLATNFFPKATLGTVIITACASFFVYFKYPEISRFGIFGFTMATWLLLFLIAAIIDNEHTKHLNKTQGLNYNLEEIKKELSIVENQKNIVNYINALTLTYPNLQSEKYKNIKQALMNSDYEFAYEQLKLVINIVKEYEKENNLEKSMEEYEKRINVDISLNPRKVEIQEEVSLKKML